jgi:DNA-binding transcriptional LysR family regulator
MNLEHVRSFVETARRGQVSAAARALHLSQPTVSRHVRALEREVGEALFVRVPWRGVVPTTRGLALLAQAPRVLVDAGLLLGPETSAPEPPETDVVTVALLHTWPSPPLTATVQRWRAGADGRQRRVRVTVPPFSHALEAVRTGEVHVMLGHGPVADARLRFVRLATVPLVVGLPAHHPLAASDAVPVAAVAAEPLPWNPRTPPEMDSLYRLRSADGAELPRRRAPWPAESVAEIVAAVLAGDCLMVVNAAAAAEAPALGLVWRPVVGAAPVQLGATLRADRDRGVVRSFLDCLRATVAELAPDTGAR